MALRRTSYETNLILISILSLLIIVQRVVITKDRTLVFIPLAIIGGFSTYVDLFVLQYSFHWIHESTKKSEFLDKM